MVGSSRISRSCSCTSSRASATRLACPPDSVAVSASSSSPMPRRSSIASPRQASPTASRDRAGGEARRLVEHPDPHAAAAADLTGFGFEVAGEHPQQRGLARAVDPDDADTVAGRDREREVGEQRLVRSGDRHGCCIDQDHELARLRAGRATAPPRRGRSSRGPGWIRTNVGNAGRFTVCSLWPLGHRPVTERDDTDFGPELRPAGLSSGPKTWAERHQAARSQRCRTAGTGTSSPRSWAARTRDPEAPVPAQRLHRTDDLDGDGDAERPPERGGVLGADEVEHAPDADGGEDRGREAADVDDTRRRADERRRVVVAGEREADARRRPTDRRSATRRRSAASVVACPRSRTAAPTRAPACRTPRRGRTAPGPRGGGRRRADHRAEHDAGRHADHQHRARRRTG